MCRIQTTLRSTAALLALAISGMPAGAQEGGLPAIPRTLGGFEPRQRPGMPAEHLPEVAAPPATPFVDSLKRSTSVVEVKLGQGRILALKQRLVGPVQNAPFLAVGDPNVLDFFVVGPQQIRLIGKKLGTTDLNIMIGNESLDFEVQVVADLDVLRGQLRQMFPDASLKLAQLREKIVVEGQARDAAQVGRILAAIDTYVRSVQRIQIQGQTGNTNSQVADDPNNPLPPLPGDAAAPGAAAVPVAPVNPMNAALGGMGGAFNPVVNDVGGNNMLMMNPNAMAPGGLTANQIATNQIQVINLIRVPTSQQVLLKVRVAELNRSGFRQIGADFLATVPQFGTLFGSQIGGNGFAGGSVGNTAFNYPGGRQVMTGNPRALNLGSGATFFGTFSHGQFNTVLNALRRNNLVKILAEPNLVALNGYQASFLAGGEFPVPTFSGVGAGAVGGGGTSGTQFKEFGVRLSFLPLIQDDETVRLTVDPEVSSVDYSVATTLVPGGSPVPGLTTRKSHTTVDLKQGDTLAIAGLMQLTLEGQTQRIPGLGDLPYIGAFFSNTTSNRVEKELVVLVTPYIVEGMSPGQVPASPGDEIEQPNDLEFFFLNRIEGRTGVDARSTTMYDDPFHLVREAIIERKYLIGPAGFSK
jgi:pilus assembly protein CpaC